MKRGRQTRRGGAKRSGAAVVEMAIAGSMLTVLLLTTVDMAQFIMVNQVVSNASRAAARHGARNSTASVSEIEATAQDYLERSLPSVNSQMISDALNVRVDMPGSDEEDTTITGAIGDYVGSGDAVSITVEFDFDATRWLSGTNILQNRVITATTIMRRE